MHPGIAEYIPPANTGTVIADRFPDEIAPAGNSRHGRRIENHLRPPLYRKIGRRRLYRQEVIADFHPEPEIPGC